MAYVSKTIREQLVVPSELANPNWFIDNFQSHIIDHPGYQAFSLVEVVTAFGHLGKIMNQAPIDEKVVKNTFLSLFLEGEELNEAPVLSVLDGELYGVGGRHRLAAINKGIEVALGLDLPFFADKASDELLKERSRKEEDLHQFLAQTKILCLVHSARDKEHLLKLVLHNNNARKVGRTEKTDLEAQVKYGLGLDATKAGQIGRVIASQMPAKDKKALLARSYQQYHSKKNNKASYVLAPKSIESAAFALAGLVTDNADISQTGKNYLKVFDSYFALLMNAIDAHQNDPGNDKPNWVARNIRQYTQTALEHLARAIDNGNFNDAYAGAKETEEVVTPVTE